MTVNEYLDAVGLDRRYWRDAELRVLVYLLLNLHSPVRPEVERFLSGMLVMEAGGEVSAGVVRDVAKELLEAAIRRHIADLILTSGSGREDTWTVQNTD